MSNSWAYCRIFSMNWFISEFSSLTQWSVTAVVKLSYFITWSIAKHIWTTFSDTFASILKLESFSTNNFFCNIFFLFVLLEKLWVIIFNCVLNGLVLYRQSIFSCLIYDMKIVDFFEKSSLICCHSYFLLNNKQKHLLSLWPSVLLLFFNPIHFLSLSLCVCLWFFLCYLCLGLSETQVLLMTHYPSALLW